MLLGCDHVPGRAHAMTPVQLGGLGRNQEVPGSKAHACPNPAVGLAQGLVPEGPQELMPWIYVGRQTHWPVGQPLAADLLMPLPEEVEQATCCWERRCLPQLPLKLAPGAQALVQSPPFC
jgi:hypothetical protein